MKQSFYFITALFFLSFKYTNVFAQGKYPVAKAYTYQQKSLSGVNRKRVDENGKIIQGKNSSLRYLFFLECYAGKNISLESIWVNGAAYEFKTEKVITPVTIKWRNPAADTLVPFTNNEVINIEMGNKLVTALSGKYLKNLVKRNSVLFVYNWEGKKYYLVVKTIKQLPPEIRQ